MNFLIVGNMINREDRINIGDHVRIKHLIMGGSKPVGIVTGIDGAYHYVDVDHKTSSPEFVTYECYHNELEKITEQEFFRLILAGANNVK